MTHIQVQNYKNQGLKITPVDKQGNLLFVNENWQW